MIPLTIETVRDGVRYIAGFGPGGRESEYRYTLERIWHGGTGDLFATDGERLTQLALFIMLNPSRADAMIDDSTVAKCMRLAQRWGFGGIIVRNIFAWRSPYPDDLKLARAKGSDPVGAANDWAIMDAIRDPRTGLIVAAWGNHGKLMGRANQVRELLKNSGRAVHAFRISGQGEPEHPLYQKEDGVTPETLVRLM